MCIELNIRKELEYKCLYLYLGLKLNGAHQLMVYADDVDVLGGSVQAIKRLTAALVVASTQTGIEVNAEKSKYMILSGGQNAGQTRNIKIDNSFFERVEQFKYLERTETNQNSIQEDSAD